MDKHDDIGAMRLLLPWYSIVEIDGTDALKFAQAQLMNDLTTLVDGHWHWSGWLTPKGRLIALCGVLRFSSTSLWLLLQDSDADDIASRLSGFVFRSKVTVAARSDLLVEGAFSAIDRPADTAVNVISGNVDGPVLIDVGVPGTPRHLRLASLHDMTVPITQTTDGDAEARLQRWLSIDLEHGLAHVAETERWTPQQLSLDRLRAYSVSKGCYPGQEIIARTHFLGQAKRGLALLQTQGDVRPGTAVLHGEQELGVVVCVAHGHTSAVGTTLAVLPVDLAQDAALTIGDLPAVRRPLLPGMQR